VSDREYLWFNRPGFVKGLNAFLGNWVPFFEPYLITIEKIDQWVRISRLPWKFWEEHILVELLKCIEVFIRVDHNTLLKNKECFVRFCLNIDVTKDLPRTLNILTPNR